MPTPRVIVFGEALIDIVQGPPGQWRSHPGGAPWNVARGLSRLGVQTAFAGAISKDAMGDEIARQSQAAGLDMRFIQRVDEDPLVAIVACSQPPRYFFAGEADVQFNPGHLPQGWLEDAQWCHFSCISLARAPLANRLLDVARNALRAGKQISFDPNWRNLMDRQYLEHTFPAMVRLAHMIKLSDEDLRHIYPAHTQAQALEALRALNPSAHVLFTRGEAGMVLHAGGQQYEQPAIAVNVIDTVGAGDACMAGWLASERLGIVEPGPRLRFAAGCASVSCRHAGAYAPGLQEVEHFLHASPHPLG